VLLLLEIDSWGWQWPEPIFRRLVPWIDPERLLYLGWFLLPPLAALGIAALARALRVRMRSAQLVLPLAGLLAAIPALSFAPGVLTHAQHRLVALTDADRQAFTTLDRIVPPDELVLTDGVSDGGAWLPILGDRDLLLGPAWRDNSAAPAVIAALRSLCASGGGALVRRLQVRWVYLGRETREGESYAERGCLPPRASLVEIELPGIIETGSQRPHLFEVAGAGAQHLDRTVTDMR
jgi:hypothetical protein